MKHFLLKRMMILLSKNRYIYIYNLKLKCLFRNWENSKLFSKLMLMNIKKKLHIS